MDANSPENVLLVIEWAAAPVLLSTQTTKDQRPCNLLREAIKTLPDVESSEGLTAPSYGMPVSFKAYKIDFKTWIAPHAQHEGYALQTVCLQTPATESTISVNCWSCSMQ